MDVDHPPSQRGQRFVWDLVPRLRPAEAALLGDLPPLLTQLLWNRGVADADYARRFLQAEDEPCADPRLMAGLVEGLARLDQALEGGEQIAVYGDYDVDGVTGTAVLCSALRRLGARVQAFIPHRERDGYGLSDARLAELHQTGVSLVVTVDCGISAAREIARAAAAGLDVIVTDHHPVPADLPVTAVLNPNRSDCAYPFKHLAGVGVAFRLAEALLRSHLDAASADAAVDELCELTAIGTLADVVRLEGENRSIVRRGLARLNRAPRLGLAALLRSAGVAAGEVDAQRVSFSIVPRLNAAGRMADAGLALDLLLTQDADEARALAERLGALNRLRQQVTASALSRARSDLATRELGAAIVVTGDFPIGIAGLLAGRLAEEFNRPAVALRRDGDSCGGSARSVAGLDVVAALRHGAALLDRFGGHAMAAGLNLKTENLAAFERRFAEAVAEARGSQPSARRLRVDAELQAHTAQGWSTLEALARIEPCGEGNPAPIFLTSDLRVAERQPGNNGAIRLKLAGSGTSLRACAFSEDAAPPLDQQVDAVYHLRRNVWQGTIAPELELLDWRSH